LAKYEVTEKQGDHVTLHVHGELIGEESADEFKDSLEDHYVDDGVRVIRLDLSDLEMISLEGVGVLLELSRESKARGKGFVAEGAKGQVREKLSITGTLAPLEDPGR
jgi:anti-anti-sigma factor